MNVVRKKTFASSASFLIILFATEISQSVQSNARWTAKMPPVTWHRHRNICSQNQYFITDCGAFWHSNGKKKKKNPYRHCPQDLTHIHYWLLCSDRCKMILKLFCQRLAWPNPTNWVTVCVHFTSHDLQTDRMQDHERAKEGNLIKVVKKTEQDRVTNVTRL